MAPTYQSRPRRRAIRTYSPIFASSTLVSSQTGGYGAGKLQHVRFAQIERRTVGQHLQRRLVNHVHRQLMTTGAETHRPFENGREVFLAAAVDHGAGRVVHRPEKHSRKRNRDVVL